INGRAHLPTRRGHLEKVLAHAAADLPQIRPPLQREADAIRCPAKARASPKLEMGLFLAAVERLHNRLPLTQPGGNGQHLLLVVHAMKTQRGLCPATLSAFQEPIQVTREPV